MLKAKRRPAQIANQLENLKRIVYNTTSIKRKSIGLLITADPHLNGKSIGLQITVALCLNDLIKTQEREIITIIPVVERFSEELGFLSVLWC